MSLRVIQSNQHSTTENNELYETKNTKKRCQSRSKFQ